MMNLNKKYQVEHSICLPILQSLTYITMLLCDALAFRTISIDGHIIAASGVIFIFSFLWLNLIVTLYGAPAAQRTMIITLFLQLLFCSIITIFVRLPGPIGNHVNSLYYNLYNHLWLILFSSSIGVFVSFFLNSYLISFIKIKLSGTHTIIRTIICNSISKAILVSISYPINFMFIYKWNKIIELSINTWCFKVFFGSFIILILFKPLCLLISKIDKIDIYDIGVSYSITKIFNMDNSGINKYVKNN